MTATQPGRAGFYLAAVEPSAIHTQRAALQSFAAARSCTTAGEFVDEGEAATTAPSARAGFVALLAAIGRNELDLVLVERAANFAEDLVSRCLVLHELQQAGVTVLTTSGEELTAVPSQGESAAIRATLVAAAEFAALPAIAALRQARPRLSMLDRARLEIQRIRAAGSSLTALARRLNAMGLLDPNGVPWTRMSVHAFSRTVPGPETQVPD